MLGGAAYLTARLPLAGDGCGMSYKTLPVSTSPSWTASVAAAWDAGRYACEGSMRLGRSDGLADARSVAECRVGGSHRTVHLHPPRR
jgi:hypothetical protein